MIAQPRLGNGGCIGTAPPRQPLQFRPSKVRLEHGVTWRILNICVDHSGLQYSRKRRRLRGNGRGSATGRGNNPSNKLQTCHRLYPSQSPQLDRVCSAGTTVRSTVWDADESESVMERRRVEIPQTTASRRQESGCGLWSPLSR